MTISHSGLLFGPPCIYKPLLWNCKNYML